MYIILHADLVAFQHGGLGYIFHCVRFFALYVHRDIQVHENKLNSTTFNVKLDEKYIYSWAQVAKLGLGLQIMWQYVNCLVTTIVIPEGYEFVP